MIPGLEPAHREPWRRRIAWAAAASAALALLACSADESRRTARDTRPRFDGVYRVSGTSVQVQDGVTRELRGLLVVRQEGDRYRTSFELETEYGTSDGGDGMSAALIGEGSGRVEGTNLHGTANTQFVLAMAPGIDAKFAFLPRQVGPRVVSNTSAHLRSDGSLSIEIETRPSPGEQYARTRTELLGYRVGDVGAAPSLPPAVAAAGD